MARRDKNKRRLLEEDMMNSFALLPRRDSYSMPVPSRRTRGAGKTGRPRRPRSTRRADTVHGNAAEKLGIKVDGFLRQNFTGSSDFHDLLDGTGIQKERDLLAAGVDRVESGARFAFVSEMGFSPNRPRRDAQSGLEDSFVEQDDVQFALERRDIRKKVGQVGAVAEREEVEGASW